MGKKSPMHLGSARIGSENEGHPGMHVNRKANKIPGERKN